MPSDNPALILQTLDSRLDHEVELTLIGKSALWLGFDDPPLSYGTTQDVDAVVPAHQSDQVNDDLAFWDALSETNEELRAAGIYLTHIFEDWQIIMRKDWFARRLPVIRPVLKHIKLFRPATLDLILSKMMRGADPQHMEEIGWMIAREHIAREELLAAISSAHVPDEEEVAEAFAVARTSVLAMMRW